MRLKNLKMNDQVYKLRRKVIEIIYSLKREVELPRIEVKITENSRHGIVGQALMGDRKIWIATETVQAKYLYTVVLHEILHAVKGIDHNDECRLMRPYIDETLTKDEALKIFKNYMD